MGMFVSPRSIDFKIVDLFYARVKNIFILETLITDNHEAIVHVTTLPPPLSLFNVVFFYECAGDVINCDSRPDRNHSYRRR